MDNNRALDLEAVSAELQDWAAQYNLVEDAIAGAKVFIHNNESDEADLGHKPVLDYSQLILELDKQFLVFKNGENSTVPHVYVSTQIGLYVQDKVYFRGLRPVGYYQLITGIDGEVKDDYLIFQDQYQARPVDKA